MKPTEFWNCTYREIYCYVKSNSLQREEDYKKEIILFDALGEKIINVIGRKNPKRIDLVRDKFSHLFEKELNSEEDHQQSAEEQIRILRSMK